MCVQKTPAYVGRWDVVFGVAAIGKTLVELPEVSLGGLMYAFWDLADNPFDNVTCDHDVYGTDPHPTHRW